ncbi:MAG: ceramidase domain-containing protein [Planctomycetes bacterium]|nr:ceramidase domain-containing protein [Planctomycetota bacterium]
MRSTYTVAAISVVAVFSFFALVGPLAQDPDYFEFADPRALWGVPNAGNVLSNLAFVAVGLLGLVRSVAWTPNSLGDDDLPGADPQLRWAYRLFFLGIFLTGFGSAYFHWQPNNWTLLADRLPMAVAFMALASALIGESTKPALGRRLLWPLIALGLASVGYWYTTEAAGDGDLRPYVLVQFLPMLILPAMLWRLGSRLQPTSYAWGTIAFYVLAKAAEVLDEQIFTATGTISGHALKHLLAALGCGIFLRGMRCRKLAGAA